ncbi:PPOX class F420-dependent oxidoreductase [Actinophytocola sediminis]
MEDRLLALLAGTNRGVVTALKRDGRPQLSNVSYHFDQDRRLIRVSVTDGRAKTANLRRDPRASLYTTAPDFGAYVVAEGDAQLSPVATDEHDDTVAELIEVYRHIAGEHPDWDDYRAAMVRDRRLVLRIPVTRVYGMA